MQTLPKTLYSAEQTRQLDSILIQQHNISATTLISRAASAALAVIQHQWPETESICIICGGGNNGADGITLAIKAQQSGYKVSVYQLANADSYSVETQTAINKAHEARVDVKPYKNGIELGDIIVDAIFGTGLNRAVSDHYATAINHINSIDKPVLSLDIPSGIDATNGRVLGCAIKADTTISFIGLNTGLFTNDASTHTGKIFFNDLATPSSVYKTLPAIAERIVIDDYQYLLAPRDRNSHKGHFGHLAIIGGNDGMTGAAKLAAEAGARTGSGLITIATRKHHQAMMNQARPELMCRGIELADDFNLLSEQVTVLSVGPGLGQDHWARQTFNLCLQQTQPKVIDADALNLLSKSPQKDDKWVLTPHPGEAARLLNCSTNDIQANRYDAVKQLQETYGGVVVLKGAGTLIYDGEHPIKVSNYGNPGMSSGGMGDVLTGIIGSLIGQKCSLFDAACLGVIIHGMAADKAALAAGERGMLAMDLMPHIRDLVNLRF
jgi:NAD(P)H-hydrate epimerase